MITKIQISGVMHIYSNTLDFLDLESYIPGPDSEIKGICAQTILGTIVLKNLQRHEY
jgi:hypothetical protein